MSRTCLHSEIEDEIDAVNEEIFELEELISLQRMKVKLLRDKSKLMETKPDITSEHDAIIDAMESNDTVTNSADLTPILSPFISPINISSVKEVELTDTQSFSSRKPIERPSEVRNPLGESQRASLLERKSEMPQRFSERKSEMQQRYSEAKAATVKKNQSILTSMNNQSVLISSVQRMSRLSTDLANERNLLAWGRTAMAAVRTALSFLALVGITHFGDVAVQMVAIGFAVMAFWMMGHGVHRYEKIKNVLKLPEPPLTFERFSNKLLNFGMIVLMVVVVVGQAGDQWERG